MDKRVIISGGGTGGHVFPAIAIAQALKRLEPQISVQFVGAKGKMEMERVPRAGFPIVGLEIAGWNRSHWWRNLPLPFMLIRAYRQARRILRDFHPQLVLGVGGYASFPVLLAAQHMGIPTMIQEQNSYAGKANQWLGRRAKRICVAYRGMEKFFPPDRILLTGNPVRERISQSRRTRSEGLAHFGLDQGPCLLVVGGSLGARSLNDAMNRHLESLVDQGFRIIWQTGPQYLEKAVEMTRKWEHRVKVYDFILEMDYAYAAADFILSRAGALAVAEICLAAKPTILVPYPYAAEDHQTANALSLVEHQGALMIRDADLSRDLLKKLIWLKQEEAMQGMMVEYLQSVAIADADIRIAREMIHWINKDR